MSETQQQSEQRLVIQLSDRTVTILPAQWPQIGEVRGGHECGQYGQNGKTWWRIQVRQHADGRVLVYLRCGGNCQCNLATHHAGEIMPAFDRFELRQRVRALVTLGHETGEDSRDGEKDVRRLMQSLPQEVL